LSNIKFHFRWSIRFICFISEIVLPCLILFWRHLFLKEIARSKMVDSFRDTYLFIRRNVYSGDWIQTRGFHLPERAMCHFRWITSLRAHNAAYFGYSKKKKNRAKSQSISFFFFHALLVPCNLFTIYYSFIITNMSKTEEATTWIDKQAESPLPIWALSGLCKVIVL
jgi:hypothetical protein